MRVNEGAAEAATLPVLGRLAAVWGVAGVGALLTQAILRLTPMAVEAFDAHQLSGVQWAFLAGWLLFMGYFEGFKGFQRAFSPRVVVRAAHLSRRPDPLHVLLAPMFCIGLVHASRRRLISSWSLLAMVVGLVLIVHELPQPWRGLVDVGVVTGLLWGLIALGVYSVQALAGRPPRVSPDLPASVPHQR